MKDAAVSARIEEIYRDAQQCAELAGLVYVSDAEPGIRRIRSGRGFSYRDASDRPITDARAKQRIAALAIPPAWRDVWICPDPDGHLLAAGQDERGRKQYLYHGKWREMRDLLHFDRLLIVAEHLPALRARISAQLRRRTLDRDQVIAAMLRIVDATAIRIGNETYAEENDSFGLSTLRKRHVDVDGDRIAMSFPAKSGKRAELAMTDRAAARVVATLKQGRGARLFSADGAPIDSSEVNAALLEWSGAHITAKDFRTWHGTRRAFEYLEPRADADMSERERGRAVIAAIDAVADALGNTRAVARTHYIHPYVLSSFATGSFADALRRSAPHRRRLLDGSERRLLALLALGMEEDASPPAWRT